jgi:hypothetical protein
MAALRLGANLSGVVQNLSYGATYHFPGTLATRDSYTDMYPGSPVFPFRKSTGIALGGDSFQHLIAVNQVGKRFFNELIVTDRPAGAAYPAGPNKGQPKEGLEFVQLDWHNASAENIRATYRDNAGIYAGLALNEGSTAPTSTAGRSGRSSTRPRSSATDGISIRRSPRLTMATSSRPTPSRSWPRRSKPVMSSSAFP